MFWLWLMAAAATLGLWWHGPIAQWAAYHDFADARAVLGLPNAANVLSNLPFALIGGWSLWRLRCNRVASPADGAWFAFAIAVLCTAAGSTAYHLAPDNAALVFDRLPIAWACAALLCAFMAERVDARWGGARALGASLSIATLAVGWWWFSERNGHGDLRPYLMVQFLPMLWVPMALAMKLRPARPCARSVPDRAWWIALALYGIAKALEMGDQALLDALGFVSGHTLKHLAAAGAAWVLVATAERQGD